MGGRVGDVHRRHRVDADAGDADREALRAQAAAVAGLAGALDEVLAVVVAGHVRPGLLEAALEVGDHPLEAHPPGPLGDRSLGADLDRDLLVADPVEDLLALALRDLRPRGVEVDLAGLAHRLDDPVGPALAAGHRRRPRGDRAVADRELGIGDHELGIDVEAGAEAVARRAHAERRVEGEALGAELGEREPAAGPRLREAQARAAGLDRLRPQLALALAEAELDALGDPLAVLLADVDPIDHEGDVVLELLVELGRLVEGVDLAVDLDPEEAAALELLEELAELALAVDHQRRQQGRLAAFR